MAKTIPFDIKYRSEIEAGTMRVITDKGYTVKIFQWDSSFRKDHPLWANIFSGDECIQMVRFKADGTSDSILAEGCGFLLIETD